MVRLSATDVARSFSDTLNRVSAGEEIEIVRNGTPVAELRPASSRRHTVTAEQWREMLATAPEPDEAFAADVAAARAALGPPDGAWPS
jgi:prevent-host-death family protein